MRFIRPLLVALACLVGLGFVLIGIAVTPPVQAWAARRIIRSATMADDLTFDSASVGLSSVTLENLQLERGGAVLAMPVLRLKLPVADALRGRTLRIDEISAQDWTLDLSGGSTTGVGAATAKSPSAAPAAPRAPRDDANAERAAGALRDWLKQLSLSGFCRAVALEGDVLLPTSGSDTSLHVVLKGGEFAPGTTATLSFDLTTEPIGRFPAVRAQGPLEIAVGRDGRLENVQFTGRAAAEGLPIPADLKVSADVTFAGGERSPGGGLHVARGDHEVAGFEAHGEASGGRVQGSWRVDLRETDVAALSAEMSLPVSAARGGGRFEATADLSDLAASGQLSVTALPIALGLPNPGVVRALTAAGTFAVHRSGGVTQISQLECDVTGNAPFGHVRLRQPCRIDAAGKLTVVDPADDWIEVGLKAFPLALLARSSDPFHVLDATADGDLAVKVTAEGVAVRSTTPIVAKNVTLGGPKGLEFDGLDASLSFAAESGAQGWTTHVGPLALDANGHRLLTLDATVRNVVDAYGRLPASGTWKADLGAWAAHRADTPGETARFTEASGEFTANLGAAADLNTKFNIAGRDPAQSISGSVNAAIDDYTAFTFRAPVRITTGADTAEVSVEGKWNASADAQHVDLQVGTSGISVDQLALLTGLSPEKLDSAASGDAATVDARPFWAPLVGRVRFDVGRFATQEREFTDIGGTVALEANTLELVGGRARFIPQPPKGARPRDDDTPLEPSSTYRLAGTITFDGASPRPYQLKATGAVDLLTTRRLFGWTAEKADALVEGHWSVTDAFRGSGTNLSDLLAHREDELTLLSTGGTLRLLRTNIADAIPDQPEPVTDTLATIGAAAGKIFGRRGNTIAGQRKLPAGTEALLNFTYQTKEIGYDKLALTVKRDRDGTLQLENIDITAPNEHLTGSGTIAYAPDRPFAERPLQLDLALAVRGVAAERLKTAGLLQPDQDAQGFTLLTQRIAIGGTLDRIDNREWHDLLAKAATPPRAK